MKLLAFVLVVVVVLLLSFVGYLLFIEKNPERFGNMMTWEELTSPGIEEKVYLSEDFICEEKIKHIFGRYFNVEECVLQGDGE